jgi:hypothetical protein
MGFSLACPETDEIRQADERDNKDAALGDVD